MVPIFWWYPHGLSRRVDFVCPRMTTMSNTSSPSDCYKPIDISSPPQSDNLYSMSDNGHIIMNIPTTMPFLVIQHLLNENKGSNRSIFYAQIHKDEWFLARWEGFTYVQITNQQNTNPLWIHRSIQMQKPSIGGCSCNTGSLLFT